MRGAIECGSSDPGDSVQLACAVEETAAAASPFSHRDRVKR
ncbi:hypothetical protein [Streptomyces sp. NPDC059209]